MPTGSHSARATARAVRRSPASRPAPEVRRCAIYTRKSTTMGLEQEFNTLDAQREACEQYIASQAHLGWQLVPERYDDGGFTGANLERPAFQRLLADIDARKIDILIVYKVDRLSRSLLDFARVMDRFQQAGVAFVSVTQNFSTADAMGRLTLNMLMSFAEFEREMIAERTRDKIAAARRRGKWTGGQVPLGYDIVDKRLVVNDLEAVIVRELFDLYEQHRSALAVADALHARGRATKRHQAQNGNLRKAQKWTKAAVLRVLRNPIYAGYMPNGAELHEGEHEALIDRDQYARARAILAAQGGTKQDRGRNPAYLLRGLLRCAACGCAFTPASTRKGAREYRYYRCVTRDKHGRKACPARPLPAGAIETFVIDKIRDATRDGDLAADVARHLQTRIAHQREALRTEHRALPGMIARLSAEASALAQSLSTVTGTARRLLEERIEEAGTELARHEARLTEIEQALVLLDQTEADARWVAAALADFDAVWEAMTTENRGRLMRALVQQVDVNEPAGTVTAILSDLGLDGEREGAAASPAPNNHASL